MSALPLISGDRCVAILRSFGYIGGRQRGSHVRLEAPHRPPVTVPLHHELDRGTLRAILRAAEITAEVFVAAAQH